VAACGDFAPVKRSTLLLPLFLLLLCCPAGFCGTSDIPVGRLINPQGLVGVLPSGKLSWEEAKNDQALFAGDSVRTGQDSRVSILCIDETQLKLNENTVVVLKNIAPSAAMGVSYSEAQKKTGAGQYEVSAGEVWLRNKNEKARFEVWTPAVTAGIRGTEFNLRVDRERATTIILLEGRLILANPQGQIDLDPGEEGFTELGKAPVKRVVLQPKDAVQWSLYYPGIFSYRDIPLGTESASPLLSGARAAYDRGDLDAAERDAKAALAQDPQDPQAQLILGWISLQKQDPQTAVSYFDEARKQNASPVLVTTGLALARYRMGDAVGAYRIMAAELKKGPPSSPLLLMSGYFSMLVGKIDQARALLTDNRITEKDSAVAHSLLSQIYLIQNSKDQAAGEAAAAMRINNGSPMARMTAALVRISYFDLPEARKLLESSLAADPHFIEAYVYLARLWLGAEYLDRAWAVIGKALEISRADSEVLSLAGFIRLGYRDFDGALKFFNDAVKHNPGFGEPHIGLANIAFRNRNFSLGLTEMLTATLLEPRVSLYQSSLGKALYQTRSFNKALEVYDYAKTLDPNDPTPYLYKGIALSDLYRPGEAIQEINKSIELNDNMAVFRSRLALDRDLAVRNADLSRAYTQLGLSDWASSKALTAVKKDPMNASARLFLADAYLSTTQGTAPGSSELLKYFLLSPANENTFSGYTDYTPMFEMAYGRISLGNSVGVWADHDAPVHDHYIYAIGGMPGLGAAVNLEYQVDPGFRKTNNDYEYFFAFPQAKYEPTIKDSLYAAYIYRKTLQGDTGYPNVFSYRTDPFYQATFIDNSAEGGFVHRFSPEAVFIGYFNWGHQSWRLSDRFDIPFFNLFTYHYFLANHKIWDFNNVQLQQQLKLGDHTFLVGFDYFDGSLEYSALIKNQFSSFTDRGSPENRAVSGYLRDYWRIFPQLLVEMGFSVDSLSNARFGALLGDFPTPISSLTVNPVIGLNYEINKSNTLRLEYQSYVNGHYMFNTAIAPSEVAGFPSWVNAIDGIQVDELGLSWESQWGSRTFSLLRLRADRIDDPEYTFDSYPQVIRGKLESFDGSFTVNRLLTNSLGLSAGISGKVVSQDYPLDLLGTAGDFSEINGSIQLKYMHPTGWFAWIKDTVVSQYLGGLDDKIFTQKQSDYANPFNLVDVGIGKYFANKRGFAQLAVTNVFNQQFYYQTEPVELSNFYPAREILFSIRFYY
jgi:tetratricopeptide (TPR) repeat protein